MRRHIHPYNGNQFVLNRNTGEVHDLDKETPSCQINDIKPEHVVNVASYEDAQLRGIFLANGKVNGCYYCLPSKNNG